MISSRNDGSISRFVRQGLKLRHFRMLLLLDETLSVSGAAQELHISQAAVSRSLAEVEQGFGFPLFRRHPRGLLRTEQGEEIIAAIRRIVADIQGLEDLATDFHELQTGTLNIGVRAVSTVDQIAAITAAFKQQFPKVTLRFIDGLLPSLIEDLQAGRLDFLYGRLDARSMVPGLERIEITRPKTVIVAAPDTEVPEVSHWTELNDQMWLLPRQGTPMRDNFDAALARRGRPPPANIVEGAVSETLFLRILMTAPALALAPLHLVTTWRDLGELRLLPYALEFGSEPLGLIYRTTKRRPAAAHFLELSRMLLGAAPNDTGETAI